jgi:hypothetical protein
VTRRLCSAPLTAEDVDIWLTATHCAGMPLQDFRAVFQPFVTAERRDADLMHTRTHRHAFTCAVCWEHIAHEACTVDHDIRLRRPFGPGTLGAFLRDALR